MTEDEKFFAWLDGELPPAEAAEMEAKVVADPALSRLAEAGNAPGVSLILLTERVHIEFSKIRNKNLIKKSM